MMFLTPTRTTRSAGCPSKAARLPFATWLPLLALLACSLLLTTACKKSQPAPAQKPAQTEKSNVDAAPTRPELEKLAREREAFGLPLPPDARNILRTEAYITVSSDMKLHELEAFYKSRLVDFEYIYPVQTESNSQPKRKPRRLHVVGLRAYMPRIDIRHTGGKFGTATLNFRPAQTPQPEEQDQQLADNRPDGAKSNAQQRRREKGMPVLDRNAQGELIAPGARWGEPYIPPEGSPLHTKRNKDNFGQPYGEWKMP